MKRILAVILLLAAIPVLLILSAGKPAKTIPAARPNIIFIMADDMGYSDIGCYGGEVNTPNINALAANGIKMRTFYNNGRCCPTRASLLTGQYPHTVGMGHMVTAENAKVDAGPYQGFLNATYPTIAEDLKAAGYHTYMVGKWHVGENMAYWPAKRGFEHYFGLISGASSYYELLPEKTKRHMALDDEEYTPPATGYYMTDAFTDHAIQYLDDQKKQNDKPFFLYVAYTSPHFPLHAYESDIKKYEKLYEQGWDVTRTKRFAKMKQLGLIDSRYRLTERTAGIPEWSKAEDKARWVRKMAVYAAMIDRMDQNIGRLINTLKANGQFDNTLIVFLSDNGGSNENMEGRKLDDPSKKIGERGSYVTYDEPWANVSNTPFKKYKRYVHEGGIATPCIMQWPAKIKPVSGYSNEIGSVIDLLPTCLELAGATAKGLPGWSLSYLWDGSNTIRTRAIYWEHEGNKAMRDGNWKLVKDLEDPQWELYDLATDPTETNNVAAANTERLKEMMLKYEAWAKKVGVKEVTKQSNKPE